MADEKEIVSISSSDKEEEDDDNEDDEEVEEYENEETEDEDWSLREDDSEWSGNNVTESDLDSTDDGKDEDVDDENGDGDDDEDSLANKVIRLLKDGCDLKALKLKVCKAYLRKYGLRLTGAKAVCIERIIEHWRIKDGDGDAVYPISSFVVNCRGDVCKGDTVLFSQKVYQKSVGTKRGGKLTGTRTVAGKVVKESYGAAKQQHTFTIEVLWSKGVQKLPPLHPLLVKGRNLYRLKTLRQPWANEDDRQKVLSEKHKRGAAARMVRDMRKERKMRSANARRDDRYQKLGCGWKPQQKTKTKPEKKHAKDCENPAQSNAAQNLSKRHKNPTQRRNLSKPSPSNTPQAYAPCSNLPNSYAPWPPAPHSYVYLTRPYVSLYHLSQTRPSFYNGGSSSNAMRWVPFVPHANTSTVPASNQWRLYRNHYNHHANPNPSYNYGVMISQGPEGNPHKQKNQDQRSNHRYHN